MSTSRSRSGSSEYAATSATVFSPAGGSSSSSGNRGSPEGTVVTISAWRSAAEPGVAAAARGAAGVGTPSTARAQPPAAGRHASTPSRTTARERRAGRPEVTARPRAAVQGAGDQPVDQVGEVDTGRGPHAREHRDGGEAGHGVDLVDHQPVAA